MTLRRVPLMGTVGCCWCEGELGCCRGWGGGSGAGGGVGASGSAQCGTSAVKLISAQCTRCRAASYCSGKCQKLHYPAHKAGCRAKAALHPVS